VDSESSVRIGRARPAAPTAWGGGIGVPDDSPFISPGGELRNRSI